MNEKIKQLREQALRDIDHLLETEGSDHVVMYREHLDMVNKKFAELIVQECIEQVKPTQHHEVWAQSYLGGVDGLELLQSKVEQIKKHFGIEE